MFYKKFIFLFLLQIFLLKFVYSLKIIESNTTKAGVARGHAVQNYCANYCIVSNTVCIDNTCYCKPNYQWNNLTSQCDYYTCYTDNQCFFGRSEDPMRHCSYGLCVCDDKYIEDKNNGHKCIKANRVHNHYCSSDSYCQNVDSNEVCVDHICRCAPNYKWDESKQKCIYYGCQSNTECGNSWDLMRNCDLLSGTCSCYDSDYHEDKSNGGKCVFNSYEVSTWSWAWIFIAIPIGILTGFLIYIRRRRMLARPQVIQTTAQPHFITQAQPQMFTAVQHQQGVTVMGSQQVYRY